MPDIKPIETFYNGYRFRSRLEARWAVFFDAAGIKYEYEPEGFSVEEPDKHYYLPDFYLPEIGYYVEVKPNIDKLMEESEKLGSMIDYNATPISDGLLVLGQIPFYKKGSGRIPNFILYSCDKGVVGELVYFCKDNKFNEKTICVKNGTPFIENSDDFNLPDGNSMRNAFGNEWHESFYELWTHLCPHVCKNKYIFMMFEPHKEELSDWLLECFTKARQARFEHGERG